MQRHAGPLQTRRFATRDLSDIKGGSSSYDGGGAGGGSPTGSRLAESDEGGDKNKPLWYILLVSSLSSLADMQLTFLAL